MRLRNTVFAFLPALAIVGISAALAAAEANTTPTITGTGSAIDFGDSVSLGEGTSGHPQPHPGGGGGLAGAPAQYNLVPVLLVNPASGTPCVAIVRAPYNPATSIADEARTIALIAQFGPCPNASSVPVKPPPSVVATQLWRDQVHLPKPEPQVAPGKAIVGADAFLDIQGPHSFAPPALGAFGDTFAITAKATHYDVSWGDGESTHTTSAGGPYPSGDVRHAYVHDGTVTIRVVEYWQGFYALNGGAAQPIPGAELRTEQSLSLPVEQVQAVGG